MFKKFISLASMVAILGTGTLIASADELNTYSPETGELPYQGLELELGPITYDARTSRSSVNYSTSGFRNYVEPKTSFKSSVHSLLQMDSNKQRHLLQVQVFNTKLQHRKVLD